MTRPLLRAEISAKNSRDHLLSQQKNFVAKHGEDLGTLYCLVMLIQTIGRKALKRGDMEQFRSLAHDLNAIYAKYTV